MKKILPFLILLLSLFSCKKENNTTISNKLLLTQKAWVIQKYEGKISPATTWDDEFPFWDNCEKDDRWVFKPDLSLELNEGPIACSGGNPNQVQDILTWAFLNNETEIEIDGVIFMIDTLDENSLIISTSFTISGIKYQTRMTLAH